MAAECGGEGEAGPVDEPRAGDHLLVQPRDDGVLMRVVQGRQLLRHTPRRFPRPRHAEVDDHIVAAPHKGEQNAQSQGQTSVSAVCTLPVKSARMALMRQKSS